MIPLLNSSGEGEGDEDGMYSLNDNEEGSITPDQDTSDDDENRLARGCKHLGRRTGLGQRAMEGDRRDVIWSSNLSCLLFQRTPRVTRFFFFLVGEDDARGERSGKCARNGWSKVSFSE